VAHDLDDPFARELLEEQRDRAERLLNRVRIGVLVLLALAALAYAPTLSTALNGVNAAVLIPALVWALLQQFVLYRRPRLPGWVAVVNPLVDVTAVTATILGYGLAQSANLALKSPAVLAYFVVLASRPIASSVRKAASVSALAVLQYALVIVLLVAAGRVDHFTTPLGASAGRGVALLDEAATLLLLAVAGAVATYATAWHEQLVRRYLVETRERAKAQDQLSEARLQSLRLQLQPHFLFNTLNAITALIGSEPRAAERMVAGLSELLRASLRSADEQEVPLARELEHLKLYTDIQRTRFGDRLDVLLDVDPTTRGAMVPSLLLQPLVENAIRHGLAPRAIGGQVYVSAARDGEELRLEVRDDGVGAETRGGALSREGVGLANTRERLRRLHGERQRFAYETRPGAGFAVRIALPFRTEGARA
jgi:two-component sensor histidine kinase